MESVLSLVLLGHDGGEAGESRAWEMSVESVLSLVLVGHIDGEAGESRAWEMSVISSGICPLFGVGGA